MATASEIPTATRPGRLATFLELRAPLDWATIPLRAPQLLRAPRGDGRPVMLLPGYGTDETSMRPLAWYLNYLGYDVYDWGIGRNNGDVEGYIRRIGERVADIHDELGAKPLTLIGWSLGGVVARETARLSEPYVREVITLGTPIIGGPKYTVAGRRFAKSASLDLDEFEKEVHARNSIGIKQPVTSIYSKFDGVVGWQASVDIYNEQARNIRVNSSHFGIGANGRVWRLIADILGG
ncbi:MAG: alpha/beta hydrolase [Gammaproteobacteria bacterium]|nr:alpha/beta hydrolase [Gammaproteobacteria bacterium]